MALRELVVCAGLFFILMSAVVHPNINLNIHVDARVHNTTLSSTMTLMAKHNRLAVWATLICSILTTLTLFNWHNKDDMELLVRVIRRTICCTILGAYISGFAVSAGINFCVIYAVLERFNYNHKKVAELQLTLGSRYALECIKHLPTYLCRADMPDIIVIFDIDPQHN